MTPSTAAAILLAFATTDAVRDAAPQPALEPPPHAALQFDRPKWEGSVNLGASYRAGNSEITNVSLGADAVRSAEKDRWTLGFLWNYDGDDGGGVLQRRVSGDVKYDRFLTERSFALAQAGALHDFKAQVDLRYTAGVGYGYQFRDDEKWKLSAEGGLSYFDEEFFNGDQNDYVAARLASSAAWNYSERWTFEQNTAIYPSIEDSDDVYANLDTRVKATLAENMFGQLQWIMDWDHTPAPGRKQTDHAVLLSVGWKF